jgi:hypothetical protein
VVTVICGRSPPQSGSSPEARTRRQTSASASARRWPDVRRSGSPVTPGTGLDSGSIAAATVAAASLSSHPDTRVPPWSPGDRVKCLR